LEWREYFFLLKLRRIAAFHVIKRGKGIQEQRENSATQTHTTQAMLATKHTPLKIGHCQPNQKLRPCSAALLQPYFSANEQCFPFTTNQHKLNFSETNRAGSVSFDLRSRSWRSEAPAMRQELHSLATFYRRL
jgi:hypothetical protein